MWQTFTIASLGVVLGMRHALEPDHLAAVSTLVAGERGSSLRGAALGAFWGLGHTIALLVVGVTLALLHAQLTPTLATAFELAVAAMLIYLGVRTIVRAARATVRHVHPPHPQAHTHLAWRPLLIGLVHGLAGSGALTALVIANLHDAAARVAYTALFGVGSAIGMALVSGLAGLPLGRLATSPRATRAIAMAAGAVSLIVGAVFTCQLIR